MRERKTGTGGRMRRKVIVGMLAGLMLTLGAVPKVQAIGADARRMSSEEVQVLNNTEVEALMDIGSGEGGPSAGAVAGGIFAGLLWGGLVFLLIMGLAGSSK